MKKEACPTFFGKYAASIRESVAAALKSRGTEDPVLLAMREFLCVDPVDGQRREVPLGRSGEMIRLYFQFLKDNERLPLQSQLRLEEIRLIWETLLGFFGETEFGQEKIGQVFRLVQHKMEQGQIGQAWIILNIFDYQRSVKVDNERNLFLEEMAQLFARRHPEQRTVPAALRQQLKAAAADLTTLPDALQQLEEVLHLRLHCLGLDLTEQTAWANLWPAAPPPAADPTPCPAAAATTGEPASTVEPAAAVEPAPAVEIDPESVEEETQPELPESAEPAPMLFLGRKWRAPAITGPIIDESCARDLLSPEATRIYCDALLKGVYFLILVTEPTGYEEFLFSFMSWMRQQVGPEAMHLFSQFHAHVTLEERTVKETLELLDQTPPQIELRRQIAALDPPRLTRAATELFQGLAEAELELLPPGDYNFGGLLLDQALGLQCSRFDLSWRLHRLL